LPIRDQQNPQALLVHDVGSSRKSSNSCSC
jgi:hypothetical protein